MYTCEFCNNEYKTISSLNNHKKTAKKCLILREEDIDKTEFFECKTCDFKTTVKNSLNLHKCKSKNFISALEKELEIKLKIDIIKLEDKNKELELIIQKYKEEKELELKLKIDIITLESKNKELELIIKEDKKDIQLLIKQNTELKEKLEKQTDVYQNQMFSLASKPTNTNIKIQNLNNV
jgi:hypothetical protein